MIDQKEQKRYTDRDTENNILENKFIEANEMKKQENFLKTILFYKF